MKQIVSKLEPEFFRRIKIVALVILFSIESGATFTFIQKANNTNGASGNSLGATVSSTGSGNLIVAFVGWEGTTGSSVTVSDGFSNFTSGTVNTGCTSDCHGQWFYKISSTSGSTNVSATWSANRPYRSIHVYEYSYTKTPIVDVTNNTASSGVTVQTSNFSTTGYDELVFAYYKEYNVLTLTNPTINSVAPDQSMILSNTANGFSSSTWVKAFAAPFTNGRASGDLDGSSDWLASVLGFKIAPGVKRRVNHSY